MQKQRSQRRPHGSGSIIERHGAVHVKFRPVAGKPPVQRKICRVGDLTKTEIEAKARSIISEYRPLVDETPTFAEVGRIHVHQLELDGKAPSYTKNRWRTLRGYLEPEPFADMAVSEVRPKHLNAFKAKLQRQGKSASTIISVFWLISGVCREAMRHEWRTDNPVAAVQMPEKDKDHAIVYMTTEEVDRIIAAVPDDDLGRIEKVLYRAGQKSGLRRSELLALKWKDCDFNLGVFRVSRAWVEGEFKAPKGRRSRVVPMLPDLRWELELLRQVTRFPDDESLLFTLTGEPLRPETITKRFNRALLRAKVGPVEMKMKKVNGKYVECPHPIYEFRDLRDTFASFQMMNPAVSPRAIQEALGHANLTTTSERYGEFIPQIGLAEEMASSFDLPVDRPPVVHQNPPKASEPSEEITVSRP